MKVVEEVRRERLVELVQAFGSYASLNRALERDIRDATLNQIANKAEDSKTGKVREMGSILARSIEKKLHKPTGLMDSDPDAWPFKQIPRERFEGLEPHERIEIQGVVRTMIIQFENAKLPNIMEFQPLKAVPPKPKAEDKPPKPSAKK